MVLQLHPLLLLREPQFPNESLHVYPLLSPLQSLWNHPTKRLIYLCFHPRSLPFYLSDPLQQSLLH